MTKTKKKTKSNGVEYPEESNPFGSTEKLSKTSKKDKNKMKITGKKEKIQLEGYPSGSNPFDEEESEKIRKKKEKKEQKLLRKEAKNQRKELKRLSKHENPDANGNEAEPDSRIEAKNKVTIVVEAVRVKGEDADRQNGTKETSVVYQAPVHSTPDNPFAEASKPNNATRNKTKIPISQTLDNRSSGASSPPGRHVPAASPKRVRQLRTPEQGSIRGKDMRSSSCAPPNLSKQNFPNAAPGGIKTTQNNANALPAVNKNIHGNYDVKTLDSASLPRQPRPVSLDFKDTNSRNTLLAPVKEERSPSPLAAQDVKMYRTSSISKKGKEKKRMRLIAKRLKRKKKSKGGKQNSIMTDKDVADQVVMRRPKVNIEALRKEVEEVQESARNSIINLVEQRNSALDQLAEKSADVEKFAESFARNAYENRLKNQARVTCCGLGAKWKVCWYICACEGRFKRKKRQKNKEARGKDALPEGHDLLGDGDDDDYYQLVTPSEYAAPDADLRAKVTTADVAKRYSSSSARNLSTGDSLDGDKCEPGPPTLRNKLLRLPNALRGSMPQLAGLGSDTGTSTLRSMAGIDPRNRKSSSVNALHEIVKKRGEKKRRERQEKDISKFASKYDDEETRKKVEELLRLDM